MNSLKSSPKKVAQRSLKLPDLFLDLFAVGADDLSTPADKLSVRLKPFERPGRNLSAVVARNFDVLAVKHNAPIHEQKNTPAPAGLKNRSQVTLLALLILAGVGGFVNFFITLA